mmetsp:Transcript_6976/g.9115  ORF Transcript_6976/g.9115 Transcript_6976/m.9115 type:complete len:415 (-) Transcript_6976:1041-2285(-)
MHVFNFEKLSKSWGGYLYLFSVVLLFFIVLQTVQVLASCSNSKQAQGILVCARETDFMADQSKRLTVKSDENQITRLSVTSFNILCPKYFRTTGDAKRVGRKESDLPGTPWKARSSVIAKLLLHYNSDIFCLQEFWLPNDENDGVLPIFEDTLGHEYGFLHFQRTGSKQDGLLIGYRKSKLSLMNSKQVVFPGFFHYNRVGLVAHLRLRTNENRDIILGTTHIFFPEHFLELRTRNQQVNLMYQAVEGFIAENSIGAEAFTLLVGDFNSKLPPLHVEEEKPEQGYISTILEYIKRAYDGEHWWDVLRKSDYKSSYRELSTSHDLIYTHVAHTDEHSECDFVFYKGKAIPTESYLEPRPMPDDLKLLRPVTQIEIYDVNYDALMGEMSADDFLQAWASISDHRPKTSWFDLSEPL